MAEREEDQSPPIGHNQIDDERLQAYESRIMALHNSLEETSGQIRNDIKQVYNEAKADLGVPVKVLKMGIAEKRAEQKRAKKRAEWDESERETYAQVREKLGILADTPLGDAALAQTGNGADAHPA